MFSKVSSSKLFCSFFCSMRLCAPPPIPSNDPIRVWGRIYLFHIFFLAGVASNVNHEMDCRTAWLGGCPPRCSRSYQRYTVHERALYFNSTFLKVTKQGFDPYKLFSLFVVHNLFFFFDRFDFLSIKGFQNVRDFQSVKS